MPDSILIPVRPCAKCGTASRYKTGRCKDCSRVDCANYQHKPANLQKPCVKCGAIDRNKGGQCNPCRRISAAASRAANPEKVKARNSAWYAANSEKEKANSAAYRVANPEKVKANVAAWRSANPEKEKASSAAYRAANPGKVKADLTAWRAANKDKVKASQAVWRVANPEKMRARAVAKYAANPEKAKAEVAAWQAANPEKVQAYKSAWNAANPEARRITLQNRRAKKRVNGGKLSRGLAKKLFKLQKGMCPCCAQPLGDDYHLDHVIPIALGGSNTDDNIQLLRARCNLQKNAKHPVDFMQSRGFLL